MSLNGTFTRSALLGPALVGALALAACGSDYSSGAPASSPSSSGSATVDVATTGLGPILVDSNGRTLYLFEDVGYGAVALLVATAFRPHDLELGVTVGDGPEHRSSTLEVAPPDHDHALR
jgi:hypothetical protein